MSHKFMYCRLPGFGGGGKVRDVLLGAPQLAGCFAVDFWARLPVSVLVKSNSLPSACYSVRTCESRPTAGCRPGLC